MRMGSKKPPLSVTHPELATQAEGWDPTTISAGSNKKLNWRCGLGHEWATTPNNRAQQSSGCPFCSGKRALAGFNDLATTHPELARDAIGWDPTSVRAGSGKKVSWQCCAGHRWEAIVKNRALKKVGCPICSNHLLQEGVNDLLTTHPRLAQQADGWDPATVVAGTDRKVKWRCELGHRWAATVNSRKNGNGCPVCANYQVVVGFNDLATTHPKIAAEADGWDPEKFTHGAKARVAWRCEFGHAWSAQIAKRSAGQGCPVCVGRVVLAGFNDLATTHPKIAAEADGWDPATVVAGSNKRVRWVCDFGHRWTCKVGNRTQGYGCPGCAKYGFDPNLGGWLYFLSHETLGMFQIGISNYPESRMASHQRGGWELIELRGPMEGRLAAQLETSILHAVERRGGILGHKAQIEKFDGYSEAWMRGSLQVSTLKELLDWVYEDDSQI